MTEEEKLSFYTSVAAALIRRAGGEVFITKEELSKQGSIMWKGQELDIYLKVIDEVKLH